MSNTLAFRFLAKASMRARLTSPWLRRKTLIPTMTVSDCPATSQAFPIIRNYHQYSPSMAEEMSGKSETSGNANGIDIGKLEALKESLDPLFLRKLSMVTIKIQKIINCRVTGRLNRIMEEECSEAIRENAKTTGATTTQDVQRILDERKPNVERVIREDVLDEYGIGAAEFAKLEAIAEPVPSRLRLSRRNAVLYLRILKKKMADQ